MRRFIVCAATLWIAQSAAQPGLDRRTFVARAIRRSPTNDDVEGLPMARGLRPKTSRATTTPATTTTTTTTPVPTRAPTVAPPQRNPGYPQQQQYQNYQYQQHQAPPPFFNPFMPFGGYQGGPPQGQQPMMVPVPVPVAYASMPGLPGIPNLMQPLGALPPPPPPTTTKPSRKSHKRHRYATLRPEVVEEEQMRSAAPIQEEIDAMDRNEVRRAPTRRRHQQPKYYEEDYSEEEETSTAATLFPTLATMAPMMKMPTLPPFTLPPSFEKLLGITTPKPKKEKRRKEKRRREYEDEEDYEPVKRRRAEEESRPHGRSLAVEEDRGRRDPFEGTGGFEEQQEEKDSAPSVADRLMRKGLSSNKKAETGGDEEDWLVPFRR